MNSILTGLRSVKTTDTGRRVAEERYLMRGPDRELVETMEEMYWRVAQFVAGAEKEWCTEDHASHPDSEGWVCEHDEEWAVEFYAEMASGRFLPNSPTLMNAGTGNGHQLSACYVLPIEDSLDAIYRAVGWQAKVLASGGGCGFSFSRLRPKGSPVGTTQGVAGGPVAFIKLFDVSSEQIKQGGKRAGANMAILRVDHPDILEFIDCKRNGGITNFNISVGITNDFMDALGGRGWGSAVGDSLFQYRLHNPYRPGEDAGTMDARMVMAAIVQAAWETGDPGLVFPDRANRSHANPVPDLPDYWIESTNPCSEQWLAPFDACNLGSINLLEFVVPQAIGRMHQDTFDWERLKETVHLAVRFLDDVITVNDYPLPQIDERVKSLRRIGLGVMGWADALFKLGIPYDSNRTVKLAGEVMEFINREAYSESQRLGLERGGFPLQSQSIYRDDPPLRNAARTTIAPTGSISILAGVSSGIEPVFALAYRHIMNNRVLGQDEVLYITDPVFCDVVESWMRYFANSVIRDVAAMHGSCQLLLDVPQDMKDVFKTAHEIDWPWHVDMQAAFQKYLDNGTSKTINLPNNATIDTVFAAYMRAWNSGCLGITVYRDGCKGSGQALMAGAESSDVIPVKDVQPSAPGAIRSHPDFAPSATHRVESPLGTVYTTVASDELGPMAVFIKASKAGDETNAIAEAMGRMASAMLRTPSPLSPSIRLAMLASQLRGIGGDSPIGYGDSRVRSFPDAIGIALERELRRVGFAGEAVPDLDAEAVQAIAVRDTGASLLVQAAAAICPECGHATFVRSEGCLKCAHCGMSKCD